MDSQSLSWCSVLVPLLLRECPTQDSEITQAGLRHKSTRKGKEWGPEMQRVGPDAGLGYP